MVIPEIARRNNVVAYFDRIMNSVTRESERLVIGRVQHG